jgi:hypothetical protein
LNSPAYTSSVIAEARPSICCTTFGLAPDLTARLAAVWRKSCTRKPGRPQASVAGSQIRCRKFELRTAHPTTW